MLGGTTHGALYLLDREHEHFRRAGLVGLAAESCFPGTFPLTHTIPQHLSSSLQTVPGWPHLHNGHARRWMMRSRPCELSETLPHVSRGPAHRFFAPRGNRTQAKYMMRHYHVVAQRPRSNRHQCASTPACCLEDLHRSHALMKRTDRLKSLETIAGGFAHEIRNPLTSIKTFIQLAPERKDDADFIREFSRIVLDDVYRIERLIEEILDYARYMEPKLTEEDVNDIVSSCLYFIEVKADSHGIKIEKELAPDLPRVMLDRQQIKQVFLNLFLNAMDAMSEKGGGFAFGRDSSSKPGGKPGSK